MRYEEKGDRAAGAKRHRGAGAQRHKGYFAMAPRFLVACCL